MIVKVVFLHMPGMPAYWPVLRKLAGRYKKVASQQKNYPNGQKLPKFSGFWPFLAKFSVKIASPDKKVAISNKNGHFWGEKWPAPRAKVAC